MQIENKDFGTISEIINEHGNSPMDEDIDDYIDCLEGDLREEAKEIVRALNNDRNQAQKARLEARMATTQINQKIHDIAEARWKMLPIAIQREHDILAMDISELQWHVKQEKQELKKAKEKLEYASTINRRLKADIDFNKKHAPLVEEKLRIEQEAMVEIKKEQEHQNGVLQVVKVKLKNAEEDFDRESERIIKRRKGYEDKLDKVTDTLNGLKADLHSKEQEAKSITDRIDATKTRINIQKSEIEDLKNEAIEMRKQERDGIARIDQLKLDIKDMDEATLQIQADREILQNEIAENHENYQDKLLSMNREHAELVKKLEVATNERNDLRLQNEDSKRRQNIAKTNIQKLEKETERLAKDRDEAQREFHKVSGQVKKLEQQNAELLQTIEKKERSYQQIEENLQSSIDQTRKQIEEEIKAKNLHEQRYKEDSVTLEKQVAYYKDTKEKMDAHIDDLNRDLERVTEELEQLENEEKVLTVELEKITETIADRTKLNEERVTVMTEELKQVTAENDEKQGENDQLTKQLNDIDTHQRELENRTKDLINQQNILSGKTVKLDAEIKVLTKQLSLVENEYQVQLEANRVQKERLETTKELYNKRKDRFEQLVAEREKELEKAKAKLKREIELNVELAKRYKVLHAQQIATKDSLAGFYETRVGLEDTKVWLNRFIDMESKYFEKTTQYYKLRDEAHKAEYCNLQNAAANHINQVEDIKDSLKKDFDNLSEFLNNITYSQQQIDVNRRDSMVANLEPVKLPQIA